MTRTGNALAALMVAALVGAAAADAQTIGTFNWQLAPYCNVVTVTVTQSGGLYTLDGYENQCGGTTRAALVGMAVPNPNGSITLGFTIVTPPDGVPVHVQTAIDIASLGGTWTDNLGHTGAFVFTASGTASGSPRPAPSTILADGSVTSSSILDGSVGLADINAAEIQRRVAGVCPAGQLMTAVQQDGAVTCEAPPSNAGGDITGVAAGTGLQGGGVTGDVTLNVVFSGTGTQALAARADHTHGVGTGQTTTRVGFGAMPTNTSNDSTAIGASALAANGLSGLRNTAVGSAALVDNATGLDNTAVGAGAIQGSGAGSRNTAVGSAALSALPGASNDVTALGYGAAAHGGSRNTAIGSQALAASTAINSVAVGFASLQAATEGDNTAVGTNALSALTTGRGNLAIGANAGANLTSGDDNLYLAHAGVSGDSHTVRVGRAGQNRFFAAGIRGVTTGSNNAVAVVIDSAGQLGTVSSSRKTKFDIDDLAPDVTSALQRLRPVQFRYKQPFADGTTPLQYGLIAEEVQEVLPELVALDEAGDPATVKYHVLPSLLLAEVQRLTRELALLKAELATLAAARH